MAASTEQRGRLDAPLDDYWKEFNTFDDGGPQDEDEEDFSKTPDEGEAEEEWLREAGFEKLVDTELTEQDEADFYEDILATLTARQIAVVKKRLDTVQMSKKRRVPRSRQRADVRDVFSQASTSPPESLSTIHSEPLSLVSTVSSGTSMVERWSRRPPSTHLPKEDPDNTGTTSAPKVDERIKVS